ncbi:hypothetical protein CNBB2140 [Cryptococcus deneoformans B-3501A]|uniref:hypothetical protein n=1 Tax=Cryptococcus deneoformans (strain B-3501A) TaxID=283643 RepID=UPI000042D4B2|nr:hypothetical protein CNBB2140 [Cryptococcus neoformans var. neoformans B-3501A]EAL22766.1 hypothetical protein CNBB2140 [Cryptococcus neoformans var. neoformans B-3501A]
MFPGIAILTLCLPALLASATPFKERSGAPINGMTLSVDSGKLCEGHQVNISWGDTSLGASPYHLQIGIGGYYTGVNWTNSFDNVTESSFLWNVSNPAKTSLVFQVSDALNATTYVQNQIVRPGNYCDIATQPSHTVTPVASFVKPIVTVPTISSDQNRVDQVDPPIPVSSLSPKKSCHIRKSKPRNVNNVNRSVDSGLGQRTAH